MGVVVKGNVVTVFHRGMCTAAKGKVIAADLLQVCEMLCQIYDKIVVFHDTSRIEQVDDGYSSMIGAATDSLGCCERQVAAIPDPMHRLMAREGRLLGPSNIVIYKHPLQVQYWLRNYRADPVPAR